MHPAQVRSRHIAHLPNAQGVNMNVKPQTEKAPWEPMTITFIGQVSEIIHGGKGKLSLTGGDPGEARKEKPH